MRVKSLSEPAGILNKGDEWLSPDGHSSTWRRVWNGTTWDEPEAELEEPEDLNEVETDDIKSTEDPHDEQGMQTAVSDRDGGEQGTGGGSGSEPKQRGERGKVRKGRKGK